MEKIRKITIHEDVNAANEVPGAKFIDCAWTTCDQQCSCQFAQLQQQWYNAHNYYVNHNNIWNPSPPQT